MPKIKIKEIQFTAFDDDHSINDIHIVDLIPNVMGQVTVFERNGEHVLDIPEDMDTKKWKLWINTAAGIFSKDFLAWMKDKANPEYMLIESIKFKTVIRLIDAEDLERFESLRLINGKIKDTYFMHLKTVNGKDTVNGHEIYIKENKVISDTNEKEKETDDENQSYHSKPLFK